MNKNITKLVSIAGKNRRLIIGLMSGTSFDGLDVALCAIEGAGVGTKVELLRFDTVPYQESFKEDLKAVFSKEMVDLQKLTLLHASIGQYHGQLINQCLGKWGVDPREVDVIASHGQTIFHAPRSLHGLEEYPNATLQIGDGDHVAVKTGIVTLSDFRQKHVAAGGEGAPLAVYGDYLIFSDPIENRVLLNIGGIANYTFLPAGYRADQVFSSDVGPGNTLMDQFVQLHYPGTYYDQDAKLASSGQVCEPLLQALLDHPFFKMPVPKTTGPELFNLAYLERAIASSGQHALGKGDTMATLCRFSAHAIARAINDSFAVGQDYKIYLSGGGAHNPLLLRHLCELLHQQELMTTESLGIDPDAKEAILFALLANEALCGDAIPFGKGEGIPPVTMGKVSFPD